MSTSRQEKGRGLLWAVHLGLAGLITTLGPASAAGQQSPLVSLEGEVVAFADVAPCEDREVTFGVQNVSAGEVTIAAAEVTCGLKDPSISPTRLEAGDVATVSVRVRATLRPDGVREEGVTLRVAEGEPARVRLRGVVRTCARVVSDFPNLGAFEAETTSSIGGEMIFHWLAPRRTPPALVEASPTLTASVESAADGVSRLRVSVRAPQRIGPQAGRVVLLWEGEEVTVPVFWQVAARRLRFAPEAMFFPSCPVGGEVVREVELALDPPGSRVAVRESPPWIRASVARASRRGATLRLAVRPPEAGTLEGYVRVELMDEVAGAFSYELPVVVMARESVPLSGGPRPADTAPIREGGHD